MKYIKLFENCYEIKDFTEEEKKDCLAITDEEYEGLMNGKYDVDFENRRIKEV